MSVDERRIRPHDFRRPSKFTRDHLRTLEFLFESWARAAALQFAATLRVAVEFNEIRASETIYGEFHSELAGDVMAVIEGDSLPQNFLLALPVSTALFVVDRVLGGGGVPTPNADGEAELSDVTRALLQQVLANAINEQMADSWSAIHPIHFQIGGIEDSAAYAQAVGASEPVAAIRCHFIAGEIDATLVFCVPYIAVEPLMESLSLEEYFSRRIRSVQSQETLREQLPSIPVELRVVFERLELPYEQVRSWRVGDVIPISNASFSQVEVEVGNVLAFLARPHQSEVEQRYLCRIIRQLHTPKTPVDEPAHATEETA